MSVTHRHTFAVTAAGETLSYSVDVTEDPG
jgi:hypothetical protein